jgi:carbon monoxide dehydrogenase subunit G
LLSYNVEAENGGKLTQFSQRLIKDAATTMADQSFVNSEKVSSPVPAEN